MKKVVKFGGSSLASAEQFRKVAGIIHADPDRRYVVPSAPGKRFKSDTKVTDLLYACQRAAEAGLPIDDKMELVAERYRDIIRELDLSLSLEDEFEKIKKDIIAGAGSDYAASRGEYLNGQVLAAFLGFPFIDAADVIRFGNTGAFLGDETNDLLRERLDGLEYAVIPGFYGRCKDGHIHTFSRGGSDITGSIVARAVRADMYENWTDVSGVLITDPSIIPDAKPIPILTYRELRELSYMGFSVLHEEAIFPVRSEGIPIHILNTNDPAAPGTMIVDTTSIKSDYVITGIAGKRGFVAVNVDKAMMNAEIGFGRRVLQAFEDNGISFEHLPSGIDTMTVFVHQDEFEAKEQQVLSRIRELCSPDLLEVENGMALIAVVGRGMRSQRGTAGRIFSALAHARVNVRMIDQGSSELNIIIGVSDDDFAAAIRAIYDIFVNTRL